LSLAASSLAASSIVSLFPYATLGEVLVV